MVAAADPADGPGRIKIGKVALAAGAAVDGNDGDFAAGDADSVRGVGIGRDMRILGNWGAPPSPADPLRGEATAVSEDRRPRLLAWVRRLLGRDDKDEKPPRSSLVGGRLQNLVMSTPTVNLHPGVDALLTRAGDYGVTVRRYEDLIVVSSAGRPSRRFRPELGVFTAKQQRRLIVELVERGVRIDLDDVPEELQSDHLRERLVPGSAGRTSGCPTPTKIRFRDRAAASLAMDRIGDRNGQHFANNLVRVYRCPCGGWHITSRPARR
ncbi:Uncharacterised protein [Mycobacteroides abscessus]|nr:Uncharacterised protein [Mycobacteroides abscessus]